jgi:hypothetical protein
VYPRVSLLGNGSVDTNTRNNRKFVGSIVFYTIRVVSKESLWVCLCIPLSLLGNGSVNTLPRQRRIVGDVVLYTFHVVSKESRRFVLPRNYLNNLPVPSVYEP